MAYLLVPVNVSRYYRGPVDTLVARKPPWPGRDEEGRAGSTGATGTACSIRFRCGGGRSWVVLTCHSRGAGLRRRSVGEDSRAHLRPRTPPGEEPVPAAAPPRGTLDHDRRCRHERDAVPCNVEHAACAIRLAIP